MARQRSIPIYLFSVNARSRRGVIDYLQLFRTIAATATSETLHQLSGDLTFAIDLVERTTAVTGSDNEPGDSDDAVFAGHVIAGAPGDVPQFFDYKTGTIEVGTTPDGKWLAQLSRVFVSLSADYRYLVLEGGRNGVSAARLERYFRLLSEQVLAIPDVEFDIIPVQSESLRDEIESFDRIKQASAIVTRPNFDWTDMSDKLSALAEESAGHEAVASVKAARNGTLSKQRGIVGTILSSLGSKTPAIRRFTVVGRKPNADRDSKITSEKHQQRDYASVARTASTDVVDVAVYERARLLIDTQLPSDVVEGSPSAGPRGGDGGREVESPTT